MFEFVRYSFAIAASFCVAALAGQHAFGQVPQKPTYSLALVVPIPTGARPQVSDEFSAEPAAPALRNSRAIRAAPNGDLFVADTTLNAVHVLRHTPGSAQPARDEVFANGLKQPCGIAFYPIGLDPRWVYIADSSGVVRFRYRNGDLKAAGKPERIIAAVPTTHHCARDIAFWAAEDGSGTIQTATYHESAQGTHNADAGRDLYLAHCSACHQAGGEGIPGVFPPLKGSGVVNRDDAAKHIRVILDGMQGARAGGVVYTAVMPPFAGALSDAEIAGIIDYERSSWGNHGALVTAAQVAAERALPE
jgi:mono/diheme cytochrome c family protein